MDSTQWSPSARKAQLPTLRNRLASGSNRFLSKWHIVALNSDRLPSNQVHSISNSSNSHSPWYFTYSFTIFTRYHVSAPQSVIISWILEPEGSGSAGLGAARPRSPGPRGRQDSFRSSSGDLAVQGGLVIHPEVVNAKVMLKRNAIDKMEYSRCTSTCSNLFVDFPPKSHYLKCIIRTFERTTENSKLGSRHLKAAMNWHMCYG